MFTQISPAQFGIKVVRLECAGDICGIGDGVPGEPFASLRTPSAIASHL
jgi:hypothetical protein